MSTKIISPSLLAADFANLERDIELFNNSKAQWLHIDIMDGVSSPTSLMVCLCLKQWANTQRNLWTFT